MPVPQDECTNYCFIENFNCSLKPQFAVQQHYLSNYTSHASLTIVLYACSGVFTLSNFMPRKRYRRPTECHSFYAIILLSKNYLKIVMYINKRKNMCKMFVASVSLSKNMMGTEG
uniref:Uncharacterized protein n=1 Tax=Glossina brevipalpis TaxID=37001 RepID=A0A1A9W9K7_9MUSC